MYVASKGNEQEREPDFVGIGKKTLIKALCCSNEILIEISFVYHINLRFFLNISGFRLLIFWLKVIYVTSAFNKIITGLSLRMKYFSIFLFVNVHSQKKRYVYIVTKAQSNWIDFDETKHKSILVPGNIQDSVYYAIVSNGQLHTYDRNVKTSILYKKVVCSSCEKREQDQKYQCKPEKGHAQFSRPTP